MKYIVMLLLLVAQETHCQSLSAYFNDVAVLKQLNGNVLLAEKEKIIYQYADGYADFSSDKLNYSTTRYNLASISKIFTSTAILQLKEKGKLQLEDAVIKYLPDFPYPNVTIRHLLTHTSGLPDLELFETLVKQYPDTIIGNDNIIPELLKWGKPLYFTPGDKFEYTNNGFALLAMITEKISGLSFGNYLKKNIFLPAKMLHTSYETDSNTVKLFTREFFYDSAYVNVDKIPRFKYTHYNCNGDKGASNIITTTGDMLAFDQAFFSGKLISKASMEEAFTPVRLNNGALYKERMDIILGEGTGYYGLGWEIFEQPGYGKSVGHGGYKRGLATFYFHNLDHQQTIIAYDNTAGSEFGRVITSAFNIMNKQSAMPFKTKKSLVRIYGQTLVEKGSEYACSLLNTLKRDTTHYYMSEWEMNQLGGTLLYFARFEGHQQLAVEAFKLNTFLFPDSFNTYDSYADGLKEIGKKDEAIMMYRYSIVLNPDNREGKDKLQRLTEGK